MLGGRAPETCSLVVIVLLSVLPTLDVDSRSQSHLMYRGRGSLALYLSCAKELALAEEICPFCWEKGAASDDRRPRRKNALGKDIIS